MTPAPGAYEAIVEDDAPKIAFGIKHSPYVGALKGDDWVSARTETTEMPTTTLVTNGHNNSGASNVTSNTRTHSDGTRIRTETFSYSQGPTVRTTTTTKSSTQGPTIRTSTQQVSQAAF